MSFKDLISSEAYQGAKDIGPSDLVTKVFIPLGSTLVATVAILVEHDKLPHWVYAIGGGYLVVVTVVLLSKPVRSVTRRLLEDQRRCANAKRDMPHLLRARSELFDMLEDNRSDTLRALLKEIGAWSDVVPRPAFESEHLESLRCWIMSVGKRLEDSRNFRQCASDLSVIVAHLNRQFVQKQQELESLIVGGKIPNHRLLYLKREWNLRRERHAAFVRGWRETARGINSWAGPDVCGEYYQELASLE